MLVQARYLIKTLGGGAIWQKEIYDVVSEVDAYNNVMNRYGQHIIKIETKKIGSDAQASNTHEGRESQGAMFGDVHDA